MPNWCEGDLKIRGHIDDVQKCLEYCIYQGGKVIRSDDSLELIDVGGHLKGAYRCFIPDIYTQDFYPDNVGNIIVILPTEHAWGLSIDEFKALSQQFNVDFRFYGYERGMQFNCEVEIIRGELTLSREIQFDDYIWECPNPMLGG